MLNDTHFSIAGDKATSASQTHTLTVRMATASAALPRLVNLMAKLDIEPVRMLVERSPCGEILTALIGFGTDREPMDKLVLRLGGMVTVHAVETGHGP